MAQTAQVTIGLTDREYLNTATEKSSTVLSTAQPGKAARITSTIGLVGLALTAILAIVQLYIGRKYAGQCPIDWHIPHYLVVAGIVGIILVILGILQRILTPKLTTASDEESPKMAAVCGLCCITGLDAILLVFLFIWFILGCVWVFRVWDQVQYVDPKQGNYCHPTLYKFASWLLLISMLVKLLVCCYPCFKIPYEIKKAMKTRSGPTTIGA